MSVISNPFQNISDPNSVNVQHWIEGIYKKFKPFEQARWNQANIDTLFYAGCQTFVNKFFNFTPQTYQSYYFNLIQQPVNMITGYQRQNRKAINFIAADGADTDTTDQYTRLAMNVCARNGIYDVFSKSCEQTAITGMSLMQPYLDFTGEDPAQGELKVKNWEYNSFIIDPFFRNPDLSDCNLVMCQEFIDKEEAVFRFPEKEQEVRTMTGGRERFGQFYFLPEKNAIDSDLLILTYVWYKSRRKKKKLYSKERHQFFDVGGDEQQIMQLAQEISDLKPVEVVVPTWKVAVVLNHQLMFHGFNPLRVDTCPFIVNYWNYNPELQMYDYRVRSLVRAMRDPQFLYNYKIINNNDIATATINAGWKRKAGAVQNEDNLKKVGQGWDVVINEGYELSDVEKILPSAVPQSDLELANQMSELVYNVSGINLENWSGQTDKQISSLTALIKQAANLMVFQKYFDQWDYAFSRLGDLMLQIIMNNWNPYKVGMIIGEEPTAFFYSRIFAKYLVTASEADLTPTQKTYQAKQKLELNEAFGREVLPPSMIIKDMNIQGKAEIMQFLQNQEEAMQENQQQQAMQAQLVEDARLKELYSKAISNISLARERDGRTESNIGLFEERLSEITRNRALATKDKVDAMEKLLNIMQQFGELDTSLGMQAIDSIEDAQEMDEDREKVDARRTALANEFTRNIVNQSLPGGQPGQMGEM